VLLASGVQNASALQNALLICDTRCCFNDGQVDAHEVPGPDGFPALQEIVTTARGSFTGTVHSKGPYDEDDTRYNGRYF
jgi:hypothetical protein